MAFVCPPKDVAEQRTRVLKGIKEAIESLEKSMAIGVKPVCIPACLPIADYPPQYKSYYPEGNPASKQQTPDVMLCYKVCKTTEESKHEKHEKINTGTLEVKPKKSKPFELRSGFFVYCGCKRRSGLQDFCPRMECNGSPECLPFPPRCAPSQFDPTYVGISPEQKKIEIEKGQSRPKSTKVCFKCFPAVVQEPEII